MSTEELHQVYGPKPCPECRDCDNPAPTCEDCDGCPCRKPRAHPNTMIGRT